MKHFMMMAGAVLALSACDEKNDVDDRREAAAEASAAAAGSAIAALGLTEAQLLDADLIGAQNRELGEVEQVERGPNGEVNRLLVEVEDSDPDRFVYVTVDGLSPSQRGDDIYLATKMTKEQLAALPQVSLTP